MCVCTVLIHVHVDSNPQKLQALIGMTFSWCTKNGIQFNLQKTKVMHIRHKRQTQSSFVFECGNNQIQYCNEYKYLGLWINQYLDTIRNGCQSKLSCSLCIIVRRFNCSNNYSLITFLRVFLCLPLWSFTSQSLSSSNLSASKLYHHKVAKYFPAEGECRYPNQ